MEHKEPGLGEDSRPFPTVTALPLMTDLSDPAANKKQNIHRDEYSLQY
jgi:hypothetical protein